MKRIRENNLDGRSMEERESRMPVMSKIEKNRGTGTR